MDNAWPDSCVRALVEISDEEADLQTPSTESAEKGTEFGRWQRPAVRPGEKKEEVLRKSPCGERLSLLSNVQDSARLPGLRQAMLVHAGIAEALLRKKSEILIARRSLLSRELPQQATTPIRLSGIDGLAQTRRRFEVVAPHGLTAKSGPPPDTSKPRKRVELRKPQRPVLTRTASLVSLAVGSRVLSPPTDKACWTLHLRSQASHSLLPLHPNLRDRASL